MPSKTKHGTRHGAKRSIKPEGDLQHARAFDQIVRDLPTKPVSTGRAKTTRARTEGSTETSAMIEQLYTARKLAEDTRNEIDKRIAELRRQMRRRPAA